MPGLVGIFHTNDNMINNEQLFRSMCQVIKHEGWYKVNTFIDDFFYIARISLGVTNPETQPIFNEDNSLCIFMEGEIYNYKQLKKELVLKGHKFRINNDPEFILHLFEEYGKDFSKKLMSLNGNFLFVIYDIKHSEFIVCNDRYGFIPLYWCNRGNYLLFSSEIKAILQDKKLARSINLDSMADFFSFGYILGDKTFINDINLLPPASMLIYSDNKLQIKQYWNWSVIKKTKITDENEIIDELGRLLIQAVRRRIQKNKRLGLFLSGGLDSRAVAAAIPSSCYPIHAVTFGKKNCDDYKIAKRICDKLGIEHHFVEMTAEKWFSGIDKTVWVTDGQLNVIHQHSWDAVDTLKKYVDCALSGIEGDFFLGGSSLRKEFLSSKDVDEFYMDAIINVDAQISLIREADFYTPQVLGKVKGKSVKNAKDEIKRWVKDPESSDYYFVTNRTRRFILMGDVCTRGELEVYRPFFDNDLVDFAFSIPSKLRLNHNIYNKMLLKFFPELFKCIPWQATGLPIGVNNNIINAYVFYDRIKFKINKVFKSVGLYPVFGDYKNFADYNDWIRDNTKIKEYIYSILLSEKTIDRGYINRNFIKEILNCHMSGKKNYAQTIGLLLTFELFNRFFIDGEKL